LKLVRAFLASTLENDGQQISPCGARILKDHAPLLGPKPKKETISIKKRLQIGDVFMPDVQSPKIGDMKARFAADVRRTPGQAHME